jgi:hypothetical protein
VLASLAQTFLWGSVPLVCATLVSVCYAPTFDARYLFQTLLAILLLAAVGINQIVRTRVSMGVTALVVAVVSIGPIRTYFSGPQRGQWREAIQQVEAQMEDSDIIVTLYFPSPVLYYGTKAVTVLSQSLLPENCLANGEGVCSSNARVWVISPPGQMREGLQSDLKRLGLQPVPGSRIELYRMRAELYTHR